MRTLSSRTPPGNSWRHPVASMKVAVLGSTSLVSLWSSQKYGRTLSVARWPYHWQILHCLSEACENWSYPKVVPWTNFGCQKWSPQTTFGCQRWPPLAKTGPSRTKFGNQNRSGGPLLGCYMLPYSDCWEGWLSICKQFTWNINRINNSDTVGLSPSLLSIQCVRNRVHSRFQSAQLGTHDRIN